MSRAYGKQRLAGVARAFCLGATFVLTTACAPSSAPAGSSSPRPAALRLAPATDLVTASGLEWVACVHARALFADPDLTPVLRDVLPDAELEAWVRATGGVDLKAAEELVVARYPETTMVLAREVVDPPRLEAAFTSRVAEVLGRALDRASSDPREVISRLWGSVGRRHESLVVFGREGVGFALGQEGPLRIAELFADQRLRRTQPAWRVAPLARLEEILGNAPLVAAAPGPFGGAWAAGLGGLLGTATSAGIAVWPERANVRVQIVLTGAWGERAAEAAERLKQRFEVFAQSGLGHLLGFATPVRAMTVASSADSVEVEVSVAAGTLARGLADATTRSLREIVGGAADPLP